MTEGVWVDTERLAPNHVEGDGSMQAVTEANLRGGGSLFASFKYRWWVLTLACSHEVERRIHYLPAATGHVARGYAAQWRGVPTSRVPDPPKRARCQTERS